MEKWCPNCKKMITDPGTGKMLQYAKFWRDNKCYYCDSTLLKKVILEETNQKNNNISKEKEEQQIKIDKQKSNSNKCNRCTTEKDSNKKYKFYW